MSQKVNKTEVRPGSAPASRLILYPVDPHYVWESHESVVSTLREVGLIATQLEQGQPEARYLCGDRFLSLINFLGCAPDIALKPQEDGRQFCFVQLASPATSPVAYFGVNVKSARCPACKHPVHALKDITEVCCNRCGEPTSAWELNWRRSACWARVVINLWNVYESEAVPGEQLLSTLEKVSGVSWAYCYVRDLPLELCSTENIVPSFPAIPL